mgnify:CR=1 FL=1
MTDEATATETEQTIPTGAETPQPPIKGSRIGKIIAGVNGASIFTWHTCLGSALTLEEKVVSLTNKMAQKGSEFEIQTKGKLGSRKNRLSSAGYKLKAKAQEKIVGVEKVIDNGVNRSLNMMGVPNRREMSQLTHLMQDMADSISDLASQIESKNSTTSRGKKAVKNASQSSVA